MSLRTGKPFEDFEKSGEDDYYEFLYDQYITLQREVEELKKLPKQAFNDARLKSAQLPLQLLWKDYEEWKEQALNK